MFVSNMLTAKIYTSVLMSLVLFSQTVSAQNASDIRNAAPVNATVNAAVSDGGVRFTSPGKALQMRLEVYAASGELVFDSNLRQGDILDWQVSDTSQPTTDGSYLSVVTVKDFQGKFRQSLCAVVIASGHVTLKRTSPSDLNVKQSQALVAVRQARNIDSAEIGEVTIMREGKERGLTVAAHDGQDGQVTSTSGALTFRTGDFFSNRAQEQMRVTPDGRVGIGTNKPEATLDVAGTIRARGGIQFADGTILTSANATVGNSADGKPVRSQNFNFTPNAAGTGTTNRIARWTDGASGTLGDSVITQLNGNIGIGTTNPIAPLHVASTTNPNMLVEAYNTGSNLRFRRANGTPEAPTSVVAGDVLGNLNFTGYVNGANPGFVTKGRAVMQGYAAENWTDTAQGAYWVFQTTATGSVDQVERVRIDPFGNVGIGTTTPNQKLDVLGNIKLNGAGNGIIFPDGTKLTTASAGGGTPSGTNIINAINDAATTGTINDARLSTNLGRRNAANIWSGANTFSIGLSANNALVTNVGNPVNAGDAVNKAYADANFVKFVPGAEQLSVGDANGTATMINLRGGSTCCSGPGGHTPAFFKVFQNGSFVATGNLGIGTSPMEGKGYRTSWHTYKGAFRSGYADNEWDDANVGFFSWAGGSNSTANGLYALAFGDTNFARSTSSIAFGSGNEVKGAAGFSAGAGNRVCDTYGVALGNNARSGGPFIDGKCDPETFNIRGLAAVAIGYNVTADQDHTTALGKFASNNGFQGTFIWSDGAPQASADTFRNTANNEFAARATGGFRFRTNLGGTTGCNLPAGSGVFNCTSSRKTKENFTLIGGEDVLARLRNVPVTTWNYISEGRQVTHMGPMAEDFYKAFALGTGDTSIGVQDIAGVNLAAVKALEARTLELQQKTAEIERLNSKLNAMEQRLLALEENMKASTPAAQSPDNQKR